MHALFQRRRELAQHGTNYEEKRQFELDLLELDLLLPAVTSITCDLLSWNRRARPGPA
jgi:hypothetical protein